MTTPGTLASFFEWLREEIRSAKEDAQESHKDAMNSFGAGYDAGTLAGLQMVMQYFTGDEE